MDRGQIPGELEVMTRRQLVGHHLWLNPAFARLEDSLSGGALDCGRIRDGEGEHVAVVSGPCWRVYIEALDLLTPFPTRPLHLRSARSASFDPRLFVALARGEEDWALIYWAHPDEPLSAFGLLRPLVQLPLTQRRVYDLALTLDTGDAQVWLRAFSRHWLGARRVTSYRLGASPHSPG